MKFSEIIKDLRAESDLSQMELSKKIGISAAAIGHLELGKHEPNGTTIIAYSRYFNVTTDYLLGLEDGPASHGAAPIGDTYTAEEREIIKKYRELNAPGIKLINQTFETLLTTSVQRTQNKN